MDQFIEALDRIDHTGYNTRLDGKVKLTELIKAFEG